MCGIIGINSASDPVVQEIYDGLVSLQHRGQDAAGIMTFNGLFHLKKGRGLVRDVFKTKNIVFLKGEMGIGHVRYMTSGKDTLEEAQPFYVNAPFGIALVHNGNLTNAPKLRNDITSQDLRRIDTSSDSELLLNVFAHELAIQKNLRKFKPEHVFKAITNVFKRIKGGCAAIAMIGDKGLVGFRDPYGIRPLKFGVRKGGKKDEYIIASEDAAIKASGYEIVRDVEPGEAIFIDMNGKLYTKQCVKKRCAPCIFEWVYLARPDSIIDDVSVYKSRLRMGEHLARQIKESKLKIDTVIPIPDTARSIALTLAHDLDVKYREGFVKNTYIGRTFIMPGQSTRQKSVRFKLNPIELEFKGKNVLLVDDSIVRGTTSQRIIKLAREAGAKKVYFASAAPAQQYQCVFGVDMPTRKEFVAYNKSTKQIAKKIGADALFYQRIEDLIHSVQKGNRRLKKFCTACFDGKYIPEYVDEKVLKAAAEGRGDHMKK